mmetsp:Transcript_2718/g.4178  ORF Transcript_2718/g.4178 Transcript_2718/m.4178 type:complete len:1039 (-) Transcript_2718:223-3339(-)
MTSSLSSEETTQIEALDTIMFRFATTPTEKFGAAVVRVLPKVLPMLDKPSVKIQSKVVGVLQHIFTRLKEAQNESVVLPVENIMDVYLSASSGVTKSMCLTCLAKAFPKKDLDSDRRSQLLPRLLKGVSKIKSENLRLQVLHLVATALPAFDWRGGSPGNNVAQALAFLTPRSPGEEGGEKGAQHEGIGKTGPESKGHDSKELPRELALDRADLEALSSHLLNLMLYSDNFVGVSQGLPCPGLSAEGFKQLKYLINSMPVCPLFLTLENSSSSSSTAVGKEAKLKSRLAALKRGALSLAISGIIPASESLPIILSACASGGGSDSRLPGDADSYLRRMGGISSAATSFFSLDDSKARVTTVLLRMFLGDTATAQAASKTSAIPKAKRRRSVHLRLRALVLRYLCQSKVAAMRAADSIMLVAQAVLSPGASSNEKLRLEGLEYLRWSLRNMPSGRSLSLICRNYFKFMLTLVQLYKQQKATKAKKRPAPANVAAALESEKKTEQRVQVSTKLMGAAYAVLGEIVEKSPKLVASSEGILLLFFKALQNEPSEISQQIYDGLICAANAYKSSSAPTKRKIRSILVSMALKGKGEGGSGSDNSMELDGGRGGNAGEETKLMREKLAVVECSNRLFEFTDCEARFVCLALSCNPSFKVRRSCQEGLKPLSKLFAQNSSKSPPIGGGGTQIKQPGPSSEDGNGSGGEKPSKMRRIDKQPGSGDNAPSEDTNGDVKSPSLSTSSTSSSSKIATAKDVIVGYPDFSEMVLVVFTRLQQQQQQQQLPSSSSSASSSSSSSLRYFHPPKSSSSSSSSSSSRDHHHHQQQQQEHLIPSYQKLEMGWYMADFQILVLRGEEEEAENIRGSSNSKSSPSSTFSSSLSSPMIGLYIDSDSSRLCTRHVLLLTEEEEEGGGGGGGNAINNNKQQDENTIIECFPPPHNSVSSSSSSNRTFKSNDKRQQLGPTYISFFYDGNLCAHTVNGRISENPSDSNINIIWCVELPMCRSISSICAVGVDKDGHIIVYNNDKVNIFLGDYKTSITRIEEM